MKFARRIDHLIEDNEELMEIMSMAERPGVVKFSGGFPSPETYPIEDIKETMLALLAEDAKGALSYSNTIGYDPLRKQIGERMRRLFQLPISLEQVLLTSGSQQGLDLSGLLFIDPGDVVLFETPSYLGALNVLKVYEAELVAVGTDEDGLIIEELQKALNQYGDRVKMVYVNPDHQNPTGRSWSIERRKQFMAEISKWDVAVLEDAAYAELTFDGNYLPPLMALDTLGQVIYLGTFSKTFCPGLRIGWILAKENVIQQYLALKTNVDLSSASILQRQVSYYLQHKDLDAHIAGISALYKGRRDAMIAAIKEYFPKEVKYNEPTGGLFIWAELPEGKDAKELLKRAIQEGVSFVPGVAFYPKGEKRNEFRLNFSNMSEEEIKKGIHTLGKVIKIYLNK